MPFLHLQCLSATPDRAVETDSISNVAGIPASSLNTAFPFEAPVTPDLLDGMDGLIIGGSGWSVFDDMPHYGDFQALLHEARRRRLPTFGICFGAQALADAFGGRVVRNQARAEYGTITVQRSDGGSDPLFAELPPSFTAQSWHRDRIRRLPDGAVPLAWSQEDMLQAFAFPGERIWGVQFHPERDTESFMRLLKTRTDPPGRSVADIRAGLQPSPYAASILAGFIRRCAPRP